MKKSILSILCIVGFCLSGCALDVPNDEIGNLDISAMCLLSGGVYKVGERNPHACFCGDYECSEGVTCRKNDDGEFTCAGMGYTLLPEGPCMMEGIYVCGDRINAKGITVGYQTQCYQHQWTIEKECDGSCTTYQIEGTNIMSSKCGVCYNDGVTCIDGAQVQVTDNKQ